MRSNSLFWTLTSSKAIYSRAEFGKHKYYGVKGLRVLIQGYDFRYGDYLGKQAEENCIFLEQYQKGLI